MTSSPAVATAPPVTNTSFASANRSSAIQACASASTSWVSVAVTRTASGTSAMLSRSTVDMTPSANARSASSTAIDAVSSVVGRATQSTLNSESVVVEAATWSADTWRSTRDSTRATGAPVRSATSRVMPSCLPRESFTRRAFAPTAVSETSVQANGMRTTSVSDSRPPRPAACSAESSSAGCRPKPVASATSTSTKTSSSRSQADLRPWNAGP